MAYLFWHSFWHSIWHLFWHIFRHIFWHSYWHSTWHLFWHTFWQIFWHSFCSLWLRSGRERSDPELAVEIWRGTLWSGARGWGPTGITLIQRLLFGSGVEHCDLQLSVEVRRESLWSRGCCSGPAGSGREHSDPELAVRVRRGTLRSRACSWGPVRNTLILGLCLGFRREHCDLNLQFRSGGEHSDPGLAVPVRRGTLRSSVCSWGPAEAEEEEAAGQLS